MGCIGPLVGFESWVGRAVGLDFRWLPFIGRLAECSREDLVEALYEVGSATFFATMPLWFLPVFGRFIFQSGTSIFDSLATGGLFVYSAALAGPLIYTITKKYGKFKRSSSGRAKLPALSIHFPYGGAFLSILIVVCVVSGVAFAILSNPAFSGEPFSRIFNRPGSVFLSWIAFWISTIVLYCVVAYRNMLDHTSNMQVQQEQSAYDEWLEQKS